ncbi:nuclear transport factor 2 family protein [Flavobacterium macacae]|uniref:Nuclear transport factor 2 family protein n=2 Tax=Flavobacterium macacae TaxID=2488993 RepID=A0A3P3W3J5_9FLAO|nr:nuclear transport factor 2 family protein [Flavobacterium macacae]
MKIIIKFRFPMSNTIPRTHQDVILQAEIELLKALTNNDKELLEKVIHEDIVYTNENGETFIGRNKLQINDMKVMNITFLEILEREINIFNNVAIVNTLEKRDGTFLGIAFKANYRVTRTWKFYGKRWLLIAASTVLI